MPYIEVQTNCNISSEDERRLKAELGKIIAVIPRKSEQWLMCNFKEKQHLWLSGSNDPAAIVEIKLFGPFPSECFPTIVSAITSLLTSVLSIHPNRIYCVCFNTAYWGWNSAPL